MTINRPLVRDLLDLPAQVRKGAFVLKLTEGISKPRETVDTYAVTEALVHAFDQGLGIIGEALGSGRSRAAYLHGSFGSGKSHYMAMLDLLLDGHPLAWARPELHDLRDRYRWVGQRRLLRVPIHMIGAESLAQAILSTYVAVVHRHHPEAPAPAVFADGPLFDDAGGLRQRLGDAQFFAALNDGRPAGVGSGFGDFAEQEQWTGERFDTVVASSDAEQRRLLYEALTRTLLPSYARQEQGFVSLDRGLGEVSRHAAALGYDGVVLLLDELILWLAGRLSNLDLVHRQAQQLVKLVEAQDEQRPAPVISFIARQRDLSEFVGPDVAGAERESLNQTLQHASGRFEQIVLADSNLPAIVERRVIRPRDETAGEHLADGFTRLQRGLDHDTWAVLLGRDGDEAAFRKVYPFSPVVVDAMVALSDALQRERTAIRLLTELLVMHAGDLVLGDMVVTGDLYDVLAGGEEPFDHVMKERFDQARSIYTEHLLPAIQGLHGTGDAGRCQRLRRDHSPQLGCSGCGEQACRNDNRLAKTVLLAALVPQAAPFRELTASRLVHLNHGAVATPIPGAEVQMAAQRLRDWSAVIGKLTVDDADDPRVSLRLEGVELAPILAQASGADSPAGRKRTLKEILYAALGLDDDGSQTVTWRGTRRTGVVRYGNIREMRDEQLRCPTEADWFLLIDYPFDDPGYSPEDDARRVEDYLAALPASTDNPGFAWLPTFFAGELTQELGELVKIEHVLANRGKYLGHLRPDDKTQAVHELGSLGSAKRSKVRRAMEAAYGITQRIAGMPLDDTRAADEHILSLQPGLVGKPLLQTTFEKAFEELVERLLEHRWPRHPRFLDLVTSTKLRKVLVQVERALATAERRVQLDSRELKVMREIAEPLGLLQCSESAVNLVDNRLREIEQRREQAGLESPTVADLRVLLDPQGVHGFEREVQDLLVAAYAAWAGRVIQCAGMVIEPAAERSLPGDAVLSQVDLPSEQEWQAALVQAGMQLGITRKGKVLNPANLAAVAEEVLACRRKIAPAAERLPAVLGRWLERWGLTPRPARLRTAQSGAELVQLLADGVGHAELIRRLAAFTPQESAKALQHSMESAQRNISVLEDRTNWAIIERAASLRDPQVSGEIDGMLTDLAQVLESDELNASLAGTIEGLTRIADDILKQVMPDPPKPQAGWVTEPLGRFEVAVEAGEDPAVLLGKLTDELTSHMSTGSGEALRLDAVVTLYRRRDEGGEEQG